MSHGKGENTERRVGQDGERQEEGISDEDAILEGATQFSDIPFAARQTAEKSGRIMKGANMARKRSALGRGLSALMTSSTVPVDFARGDVGTPSAFPAPSFVAASEPTTVNTRTQLSSEGSGAADVADLPESEEPLEGGLIHLSLDRILPNKDQPRQTFVQEEINRLSDSIRETGLLQPIIVRRKGSDAGQLATFEIVAGERRWRAAKQAGLTKVPALVRQLNDRETLEIGIIENVQRANLNAIEEAVAYQRLVQEFGASQGEVAASVGKDRVSIANSIRLLKLAPDVQKRIERGELSAGHGRALLALHGEADQQCLAQKIVDETLSVRQTEQLVQEYVRALAQPAPVTGEVVEASPAKQQSLAVAALEERIRRALGTKIRLSVSARTGRGELKISFFSESELESILDKLGA